MSVGLCTKCSEAAYGISLACMHRMSVRYRGNAANQGLLLNGCLISETAEEVSEELRREGLQVLYTEARPCPSPLLQRLEKQQHGEETSGPLAMSGLDLSLPHAGVRHPYCIKHCRDMSQEPISFGYPRPLQDIPKGASTHLACCCLLLRYQGLRKTGAHLLAIEGLVLTFQLDQVHLHKWKPHA
ncbi:hypothetical protein Anapl_09139 [Anas platyrhynchos]|uniref:Uncharacterized protein n=1 Tax=Anas platyrhynchos TaxID=8839 RepID=R0JQ12_ANAPL|nr:hypothetical protein Anapl_09139 [Anas platyrhynchos]